MKLEFPLLTADEIECRVATIKDSGLSLLLYKDARVDQNILDSIVGPMNWQRDHKEIKGNLFCYVSIYDADRKMWVTKSDCGVESNTASEKGEASDSFKRACFNWGIGRELYTAPFIWISNDKCTITNKNNKGSCFDNFQVTKIGYSDKKITQLEIMNTTRKQVVFSMGYGEVTATAQKTVKIDAEQINTLTYEVSRTGAPATKILKYCKIRRFEDMTQEQYEDIMNQLRGMPDRVDPAAVAAAAEEDGLPFN